MRRVSGFVLTLLGAFFLLAAVAAAVLDRAVGGEVPAG